MNYTFVCIGTNKIIADSFGPRVGNKLEQAFYSSPEISVYGTMKSPIHLKNATYFLKKMEKLMCIQKIVEEEHCVFMNMIILLISW